MENSEKLDSFIKNLPGMPKGAMVSALTKMLTGQQCFFNVYIKEKESTRQLMASKF